MLSIISIAGGLKMNIKAKNLIVVMFILLPLEFGLSSAENLSIRDNQERVFIIQEMEWLKPGDIMFETVYTFLVYVHTLLFVEYNTTLQRYIFIEAPVGSVVRYTNFTISEISNASHYKFGRVKTANEEQIENAIAFAESQLGKEFQVNFLWPKNYDPYDDEDIHSDEWYCSELIWAAYYNCNHSPGEGVIGEGIDIDFNHGLFVKPRDIRLDPEVDVFYLKDLTLFDRFMIFLDFLNTIIDWFDHYLSSSPEFISSKNQFHELMINEQIN